MRYQSGLINFSSLQSLWRYLHDTPKCIASFEAVTWTAEMSHNMQLGGAIFHI